MRSLNPSLRPDLTEGREKVEPTFIRELCSKWIVALAALSLIHSAGAEVITVYKTADNAAGSLRQAIQDASPGDTIVFHIPTTEPGFNPNTGVFTIGLTSDELVVNKNLAIDAGGQKITIQRSASAFRIFSVQAGTLTLSGLTISNGLEASCSGIFNGDGLVVRNCTFVNNQAQFSVGGAICNAVDGARLQVSNCTFKSNSANENGSAIYNGLNTTASIDNSTISGNSAAGSGGSGAAVFNLSGGTARVRNTIILGNTSPAASKDVGGVFISEGYNLIGNSTGSSGFGNTGDQLGVTLAQANLSALQDNGGPTQTMRPKPGSVAIDQGKRGLDSNNQPINNDQRGGLRPVEFSGIPNAVGGDGSDIGAVETGPTQPAPHSLSRTWPITTAAAGVPWTTAPCAKRSRRRTQTPMRITSSSPPTSPARFSTTFSSSILRWRSMARARACSPSPPATRPFSPSGAESARRSAA